MHLQRELIPMHILHATLCLIIFTIITTIIPRAVGTTADLFIYLFLVPVGEARYSCTVTPSARETTRARSRYGAARFRARRRFSSDGAVIVGCFARAPRREKKKSALSNARSFRRLTNPSTARYKTKAEGGTARRARL